MMGWVFSVRFTAIILLAYTFVLTLEFSALAVDTKSKEHECSRKCKRVNDCSYHF